METNTEYLLEVAHEGWCCCRESSCPLNLLANLQDRSRVIRACLGRLFLIWLTDQVVACPRLQFNTRMARKAISAEANLTIFWWPNSFLRTGAHKVVALTNPKKIEYSYRSERLSCLWLRSPSGVRPKVDSVTRAWPSLGVISFEHVALPCRRVILFVFERGQPTI